MADKQPPTDDLEQIEQGSTDAGPAIQTDEELQLAQQVQRFMRYAWDANQQLNLNQLWQKCDDYKQNRQNPQQSPEHPASVTNLLHRVIENQISDLLDKPYSSTAKGQEPGDDMYAEQAQHVVDFILDRNRTEEKMNTSEHDRLELGSTIIKVWFDDDELDGRGMPVFDIVSPPNFFPDPKVHHTQNLQKAEFIIHARPMALSEFRRRWPDRGKYVQREVAIPYNPQQVWTDDRADEVHVPTSQKALLLECYLRDENGEMYCLHVANYILLEDSRKTLKGKKLQRRNMYPFVMINCYSRRGTVWGMGDIEVLMPQIDLINELDDQIRMNARLMGNPQIAFGMGAGRGFDPRKWTAAPGLRVPMRDVNAFRVIEAQPVSPDVVRRREKAFEEVDQISGVQDVNRGQQPGQVTAASAIMALQQSGQKMVIHKNKMFSAGWSQVINLLFDEVMEHWDEEMWVRINGDKPDWKFINMADFKNVPTLIPNALAGVIPGEDSIKQLTDNKDKPITRDAQFDFNLNMGNGLPNDKMAMLSMFAQFAGIQFPDGPAITRTEFRNFLRDNVGLDLDEDQQQPNGAPPQPGQPPQLPGAPPGLPLGQMPPQGTPLPPGPPQQMPPQMGGAIGV
jgi:hypothetical protein